MYILLMGVYLSSSHFVYCDHGTINIGPSVSALGLSNVALYKHLLL